MIKKFSLLCLILIFGFVLRLHNYTIYPQRGATSDEYTYSFLGVSLLTKHIPISWSYFSYKHRNNLTINGLYFPIVWPYFDHPPLNGLVVGFWALLWGENTFEKIQLGVIRAVPIILTEISAIFVFLISKRKFGFKVGVWALLIYTTVPIFVIQSRVVLAENLLTPLTLLTIYLYDRVSKKLSVKHSLLFGILAGVSFWTKEAGIFIFLTLVFLMFSERIRFINILNFVFVFILFLLGYIGYGLFFDKDVFLTILTSQASRDIGPQTLQFLLSTPIIVNKIYYDGWYFLGFISMFIASTSIRKFSLIIIPAFIYLLLLLVLLTKGGQMGWYLIPLFPFMSISIAALIHESIEHVGWFSFVMILFIGFSHISHIYEENFGLSVVSFRILTAILLIPFMIAEVLRGSVLHRNIIQIYFYIFILGNIYLTYNYIHPA